MTPTDNTFFEEYKHLDKICSDIYSTSGGVSQYILDMENHFSEGAGQESNAHRFTEIGIKKLITRTGKE